jgi:uncharacterized repeat protein (TIGR01451 family)
MPAVGTEEGRVRPRSPADVSTDTALSDLRLNNAATETDRYPELPPAVETAESGSPSAAPSAESRGPYSGGSLAGDRYENATLPSSDPTGAREPAKLELDPAERVSSLPHAGTDRMSLPGSGGSPDAVGLSPPGTGTPGSRQLDGPQTPQLTIEKFGPEEIQVGKEATFRVKVTNSGNVAAHGVEVYDEVPRGSRLLSTTPPSSRDAQGRLVWELGALAPGEEMSVEMQVMPESEGEIGSVATVRFHADASARAMATKPELVVRTSAPSQVLIGEEVALEITVSNPGSGTAYGVVLEEHVPAGLWHTAGDELEYVVGDLQPNESRQLDLTLTAEAPGVVTNVLSGRAEANLTVEDRLEMEVIAPELDVALSGPKHRYLEREATHELAISNPGTAPARNVELIAHLPEGLQFVAANNSGQYEAASRTVHWLLEELPVQETGSVRLTTAPMEIGEHTLRYTCTAEPGLSLEGEQPIVVEGIAAILFQVVDVDDPIELGGETTYEIRVVNQGSKAATDVLLEARVPPGMQAVAAEGPVPYHIDSSRVIFDALPRLAPKADTTYRVRVQGLQPGDQRLSVQLRTAEMETPVTKEESTRVYSDQ